MIKEKLSGVTIGAILLVLLVWYFFPNYILARFEKIEDAGAYGDIFGAVNALFTSLAFALLIYTALLQREELRLQRKELEETRKELARSAQSQQELVELTKASYELQKHTRKNEIWPEMLISDGRVSQRGDQRSLAPFITHFILTPKYSSLRVMRAEVGGSLARINSELERLYFGRIINEGEGVPLQILHHTKKEMEDALVTVHLKNIDGTCMYKQDISLRGGILTITPSVEVPFATNPPTTFGGTV